MGPHLALEEEELPIEREAWGWDTAMAIFGKCTELYLLKPSINFQSVKPFYDF